MRATELTDEQTADVIDGYKAGLAGEPIGIVSAEFDKGWYIGDGERATQASPAAEPAEKAPEPLREALTDARLSELFDKHVGDPTVNLPWVKADFFNFARAALASTAPARNAEPRWPEMQDGRKDWNDAIAACKCAYIDASTAPSAEAELSIHERFWLDKRGEIIDALAYRGLQIMSNKDSVWISGKDGFAAEAGSAPLPGFNAEAWEKLGIKPHSTLAHIKTDDELHDLVEECIRLDREDRAGSAPLVLPEPVAWHYEDDNFGHIVELDGNKDREIFERNGWKPLFATPLSPKQEPPERSVHEAETFSPPSSAAPSKTTGA